jgi:hypothetical protein
MPPSITVWNRIEPHRRSTELRPGLRAEIRDPLWFLTRQWQLGELRGEDAGSPAYVRLVARTTPLADWTVSAGEDPLPLPVDARPIEAAVLAEPHEPDLASKVELGQTFFALLARELPAAVVETLQGRFITWAPLARPAADPFNPLDRASDELLDLVVGRAADGKKILDLALAEPIDVPPEITTVSAEVDGVARALARFAEWVEATFGQVGDADPRAWRPAQLAYRLDVRVGPDPASRTTLSVVPGPNGEIDWSSFDVTGGGDPLAGLPLPAPQLVVPKRLRYPGMPNARFWQFEEADPSYPDVRLDPPELLKMVVVNFALESGVDWFQVPFRQPVGSIGRIDSLIVRDVFGGYTAIDRADATGPVPALTRWTMFSLAQPSGGLAEFTILPPSAGPALIQGPALEQVRFARDDNANIAWGIEAITESLIGEPRPGIERDAAVSALLPPPPESEDTSSPLRYLLESRVPVHWIPLVPDPVAGSEQIILEKGVVALPTAAGPRLAFAIGEILNPSALPADQPYRIPDEEVPRAGLRVERFTARSRWIDGSSHLWVARRRRTGTGETQSGLVFDAALPTGADTETT